MRREHAVRSRVDDALQRAAGRLGVAAGERRAREVVLQLHALRVDGDLLRRREGGGALELAPRLGVVAEREGERAAQLELLRLALALPLRGQARSASAAARSASARRPRRAGTARAPPAPPPAACRLRGPLRARARPAGSASAYRPSSLLQLRPEQPRAGALLDRRARARPSSASCARRRHVAAVEARDGHELAAGPAVARVLALQEPLAGGLRLRPAVAQRLGDEAALLDAHQLVGAAARRRGRRRASASSTRPWTSSKLPRFS